MDHFPWIYLVLVPIAIAWALRASKDRQKKPRKPIQFPPSQTPSPTNRGAPIRYGDMVDLSTPASWMSTSPSPTPVQQPAASRASTARPLPEKAKPALNLDPGQFAAATDEQTKAAASSAGNLMGNPWFGRRDQIPPASDPRTILIDRAMVGQGLLTPEELIEIHKVGDEMSSLRPELTGAATIAERAVAEDREERKRIKEQKKAEAAERKRLHAEGVLHRCQTDIVFLGRGFSKGLADRRANVEKLAAASLPVLASPADIAAALGLNIPRLRWLAFH
jgi:RNA-directed DNA polymerase